MFISVNSNNIIKACSQTPVKIDGFDNYRILDADFPADPVGKKINFKSPKSPSELKVAYICNWGDRCGIATYSKLLIDAVKPKVKEIKIFAEHIANAEDHPEVIRCWERGNSMLPAFEQILDWQPDIVHIQHEFGIFPKATHFLKMLEILANTPYVITTHSVYEHLDKSICSACIKNTIVHSNEGKQILEKLGNLNHIYVIKHGCVTYPETSELWNIFQNDYSIIQFGFGFSYKGVDQALDAIHYLKNKDPKFKDLFYCYLCSENPHTRSVHEEYHSYLKKKIEDHDLKENVVILRGFLSEKIISNFLRTAKLAIFPYKNDPNNCVYGASGAVRNAMANGIPIVASDSHLFDDLNGIIPRASDHLTLANEIDHIFSSKEYRDSLVSKTQEFVNSHNWDKTAGFHLDVYKDIIDRFEQNHVRVKKYEKI